MDGRTNSGQLTRQKKRYLKELAENYKYEGFLENEEPTIGCILCTGTLAECSTLQTDVRSVYPELAESWIASHINCCNLAHDPQADEKANDFLCDNSQMSATTRSASKVAKETTRWLLERKMHELLGNSVLQSLASHMD